VRILDPLTVRERQDGIAEAAVISIALTCQQSPTWGAEGVCPIDKPPLMDVVYQAKGPNSEPISDEIFTYKTWWFMAGPEAHAAMPYKQIDKITLPILMIRGENDPIVEDWEAEALALIAQKSGNQNVRVKQISDAGHDCMQNSEAMLKEIIHMLTTWSKD
jgi:pimeloyl-ACP methyl ester carboxylesterase